MRPKTLFLSLFIVVILVSIGYAGVQVKSATDNNALPVPKDLAKPVAPHNLSAQTTSTEVTLTWSIPAWEDKYSFDIYRWRDGHEPSLLDTVPAGVHKYVDTSAGQGKKYFYAVATRKIDASISDCSAQISEVSLTAPQPPVEPDPLAGYLPPKPYYDNQPGAEQAWLEKRLNEIRDQLPWNFVSGVCPRCNGQGFIRFTTSTDGPPDLEYCPECGGTGRVVNAYPKS